MPAHMAHGLALLNCSRQANVMRPCAHTVRTVAHQWQCKVCVCNLCCSCAMYRHDMPSMGHQNLQATLCWSVRGILLAFRSHRHNFRSYRHGCLEQISDMKPFSCRMCLFYKEVWLYEEKLLLYQDPGCSCPRLCCSAFSDLLRHDRLQVSAKGLFPHAQKHFIFFINYTSLKLGCII